MEGTAGLSRRAWCQSFECESVVDGEALLLMKVITSLRVDLRDPRDIEDVLTAFFLNDDIEAVIADPE